MSGSGPNTRPGPVYTLVLIDAAGEDVSDGDFIHTEEVTLDQLGDYHDGDALLTRIHDAMSARIKSQATHERVARIEHAVEAAYAAYYQRYLHPQHKATIPPARWIAEYMVENGLLLKGEQC